MIGNRGLAGQPILGYTDYRSYAGADVFLDLTILDHTGNLQIPISLSYQIDDLSNIQNMVPLTSITPTGAQQTLQIPGSLLQMSHNWMGSQLCQILLTAVLPDNSTVKGVTILELCAIQTPASGI